LKALKEKILNQEQRELELIKEFNNGSKVIEERMSEMTESLK
jgi:hypothetical protein